MTGVHETRYARVGEVHIAYQVLGEGHDLLFVPGLQRPIDLCSHEIAFPVVKVAK